MHAGRPCRARRDESHRSSRRAQQTLSSSSFETGPRVAVVPSASTTSTAMHVIDGLAVAQRTSAGRIVADHSADRGPVAGRDIRAEHQAQRLQMGIELVEYDARLDAHGHRIAVDDPDPVQVLGKVDDDRRADRLAREAGGRARGTIGTCSSGGDRDRGDDVLRGAGNDDSQRLDLVETGVGRVEPRIPASKWTSARDSRLETLRQVVKDRGRGVGRRRHGVG